MSPVLTLSLQIGMGLFALSMLLATWRLIQGPDPLDRMLALDTLYVNALALLILAGMRWGTDLFFDAALIIAVLGFVGTVALARHLAGQRLVP
jgi:multicomponent K+:H+ antiporter subunit F